jgi:HlyD family type I secretion membrane fusion protein
MTDLTAPNAERAQRDDIVTYSILGWTISRTRRATPPALPAPIAAKPFAVAPSAAPGMELKVGLAAAALFFLGFGGWAATAPLDAAVHAGGAVIVNGHRQAVQHREGGTIAEIFVREGETVRQGQVLIALGGSEARAREETLGTQLITLQAVRARLQAEQTGARDLLRPTGYDELSGERLALANAAFTAQQRELRTRRQSLAAQKGLLAQRAAQLRQQIVGFQGQIRSKARQKSLLDAELEGIRALNEKGFAPTTRLRAMERELAALDGASGEYSASIARAQEAIGETRIQAIAVDEQTMAQVAEQLRLTDLRLAELGPQHSAAVKDVERLLLRAPVAGVVQGLSVFTRGGVARPGETLMEIVPQNRDLLIEAMVRPEDADDLRVGQKTEIRVLAFSQRDMPILDGVVRAISPDRFTDPRTGTAFFKTEITVTEDTLKAIADVRGATAFQPGLPVEVVVPLRKRTALQYLVEPLEMSLWRSFREN